jgi:predicted GNAT family N-acyltransferase
VIEFKQVSLETVIPLRHEILRKGRPVETAYFEEDHLPTTRHFAFIEKNAPICCLTIVPKPYKNTDAWQLRGMATAQNYQGKGIGAQLVNKVIETVQEKEPKPLIWCNARETAVGFYEKLGWKIDSERFVIEPIGPHFKMFFSF